MDFREYFSLTNEASLRDLKRAYAKKLKVTSPETDQEGFQYLRQVYEFAQQAIKSGQLEPITKQSDVIEEDSTGENPPEKIEAEATTSSSNSHVDEIIRCLRNGLEKQALTYLDVMHDNGDLFSIDISNELEKKGVNYLLGLNESDNWPDQFVSRLVNTLNLTEQAKSSHELDQVLDVFYKRNIMKANNWSSKQFEHDQWASNAVHKVMVEIRQCLFDEGQDAAIEVFKKHNKDGFFMDEATRYYFPKRFLTDINNYFPGSLPYRLAKHIEDAFGFASRFDNYSEEMKSGYNRYLERRKAAETRNEGWNYFNENRGSAKGLATGLLYGFIDTDYVRSNAINVAFELEKLCNSLEKDDLYYHEIGGDNVITSLLDWVIKAKKRKLSAFKSSSTLKVRRLNPTNFFRDYLKAIHISSYKSLAVWATFLFGALIIDTSIKPDKLGENAIVLSVILAIIFLPFIPYYLKKIYSYRWDSYIYRELSTLKSDPLYKSSAILIFVLLAINTAINSYQTMAIGSFIALIIASKLLFKFPDILTLFVLSIFSTYPWLYIFSIISKTDVTNPMLFSALIPWYFILVVNHAYSEIKHYRATR